VTKELDIMNKVNASDIYPYLRHHLASIRKNLTLELAPDWPGEEKIRALAESSAGLFIWASTAVKFIKGGFHPDKQMSDLLRSHPREAESALDALYAVALNTAGNWGRNEDAADFRAVLGAIVTARVPLSDETLDHMLGLDGNRSSRFILLRLHCLLQWTKGQVAKTLHKSFADYLTDGTRCLDEGKQKQPWFIDVPVHHGFLALACFKIMKTELKFNICDLETSHVSNDDIPDLKARTKKHIPDHLSYACYFWADHAQAASFEPADLENVRHFFYDHFLQWLEVLSLTGKLSMASLALHSSVGWIKVILLSWQLICCSDTLSSGS